MSKWLLTLSVLVAVSTFPTHGADDLSMFAGRWREDLSNGYNRAPGTVTYERTLDGKLKITQTDSTVMIFILDGKPHPEPGTPGAIVTWTTVGDSELNNVSMKDGQLDHASSRKVSADGKTMTMVDRRRWSNGNETVTTTVRERTSREASGFWGTWTNVSSRSEPAWSMDLKIAADGTVSPRRDPLDFGFNAKVDGKDYPVRNSEPNLTVAIVPMSKSSWSLRFKQDGKPAINLTWSLSVDGRTLTEEQTLPNGFRQSAIVYTRTQ